MQRVLPLSFLFVAFLSAAARPQDGAGPLAHVKPSVETLRACRVELEAEPAGKSRDDVLGALTDLETQTGAQAPEERQGWINGHLGGFNAAVRDLGADAPASLGLKAARAAARLNARAERWEEAREFAGTALGYDPDDRDALVVRARANTGLRDYARGYADAERATKIAPDMSAAYAARASAAYGLGNYLQAIEDAKRALALDPLDATAFQVMKLSENHTRKIGGFDETPQVSGAVEREYHGMVQQLNQVEQRRLTPVEQPAPAGVSRLIADAGSKLSVKDYWGAIDKADKALSLDPVNTRALYFRAAAHNLVGQYGDAVRDATLGLTAAPADVPLLDARSWGYNRMGRYDDAVADAHHALELEPRDAYALANRAYADEQIRDYPAMLEDYKAATKLNPQFDPDYRDAARRHGLTAEGLPQGDAPGPAALAQSRTRLFATVLASSLIGGILIGLGLLHVGSAVRRGRADAPPPAGALETHYQLGRELGQGGMGVVYEGFDKKLKRSVAIKRIRAEFETDLAAKAAFLNEARTVAELHHPAIVDIHDIVEDEHGVALVFEKLEGRTLDQVLAERRLTIAEIKRTLEPICAALEYAHARGVVHRDLKPANVMLLAGGGVKMLDFGISRRAVDIKATTRSVVGTPHYMAPEQEYGTIRKESDVFSLGALAYEMATGRRAFEGSAAVKLRRGYERPSSVARELPRSFDLLVDRALEPDPDKRLASAAEFWRELAKVPDVVPGAA